MNDFKIKLEKFFEKHDLKDLYFKCYGIGGHYYNVELRTSSCINVSFVNDLFKNKFFNIKIIDNTKTKLIVFMEIYEDNLIELN